VGHRPLAATIDPMPQARSVTQPPQPPQPPSRSRAAVASLASIRGLQAFRHRNFRIYYSGQLVSLVGTWMQTVAQSWLVLELTDNPLALGFVAAAQFLPVVVLGLFGGLIADGLPKRQTLIVVQAIAMLLAFALFGLTVSGAVEVWHVLVLAALLGMTNAIEFPTRQSFAIEMVGRADIGNAVALGAAAFNGARVVGPALAGLAIGTLGIAPAFLINGISYLAVLAGLFALRQREMEAPPRLARPRTVAAVVANLAEGLGFVRRTDIVLLATVVLGLAATFGMNFSVLVPPLARDVLGSDAAGFGFLMAASGVGSLLAALGIAFSGRTSPIIIVVGALTMGLAEIVLGISRWYPLSLAMMLFAGLGGIAMAATANTTIQLSVPDELRGRVMSVYTTAFAGSVPIGGLVMGAIASSLGADVAMSLGGTATAAVGVAGILWLRRIRARARDGSVRRPSA